MKLFLKNLFWLLFLLLPSSEAKASLSFLQISEVSKLKAYLRKEEREDFQKILCGKQMQFKKIPEACFLKNPQKAEDFCLHLKLKDLKLPSLAQAVEGGRISEKCKEHLVKYLKIIQYRKEDLKLFKN